MEAACLIVDVLQVHEGDVALVAGVFAVEVPPLLRRQAGASSGTAEVIVQGRVNTVGSLIVIVQLIVLESIIVKRSTMCAFGAVEVAAERHPGLAVEVRAVDDQRVALPPADRVSQFQRRMPGGQVLAPRHVTTRVMCWLALMTMLSPAWIDVLREAVQAPDVVELAVADRDPRRRWRPPGAGSAPPAPTAGTG